MSRATSSKSKEPLLRRDLRVEDHLDQDVAKLLAHVRIVIPVDGVDELADFIDQAADERRMRLLPSHGQPSGARNRAMVLAQSCSIRTHARKLPAEPAEYTEIFRLCLRRVPCVP
jgi:hypothetical protein